MYDIQTHKCRANIICNIALIVKKENYLWLATVGIENPHAIISAIDARHREYHPISTNPKVPITQLHGLFRCDLWLWRIPIIHLFKLTSKINNQYHLKKKKNLSNLTLLLYFHFFKFFEIRWLKNYQDKVVAEAVVLDEVKDPTLSSVQKRRRRGSFLGRLNAHGLRRRNAKTRAYTSAIFPEEIELTSRGVRRRKRSKWIDECERATSRGCDRQRNGGGYGHDFDELTLSG